MTRQLRVCPVVGSGQRLLGLLTVALVLVPAASRAQVARSLSSPVRSQQAAFGASLLEADGKLIVGEPRARVGGSLNAGVVHLFGASGPAPERTVSNPASATVRAFGAALARIDADRVLVGAPESTQLGQPRAGAAFVVNLATGAIERSLSAPSPVSVGLFGAAVAVVGNTLVIGEPRIVATGGRVYFFDLQSGALQATIGPPQDIGSTWFGASLASAESGLVVVGEPDWSVSGLVRAGRAYLVSVPGGQILSTLSSPTPRTSGRFGSAVTVRGGDLYIGEPGPPAGVVHRIDLGTGAFAARYDDPTPSNGLFGAAIAASSTEVLVGAPGRDVGGVGVTAGAAYLFERSTGVVRQAFRMSPAADAGLAGTGVEFLGGNVVVGAPGAKALGIPGAGLVFEVTRCSDLPDGSACEDGNACTIGDQCNEGRCQAGAALQCPEAEACRQPRVCNPASSCTNDPKPDFTPCSSGSAVLCSEGERCIGGVCVLGGDGDRDNDLVCELDDSCPGVSNPGQEDLDGDLLGDVCDSRDASLALRKVRLRRASRAGFFDGNLSLIGELVDPLDPPVVDASGGASLQVKDALLMSQVIQWFPGECISSSSGRIRCRKAGLPRHTLVLRPMQAGNGGARAYVVTARMVGLPILAPFGAPVSVSLALSPGRQRDGIDHVGATSDCQSSASGLTCRGGYFPIVGAFLGDGSATLVP